MSEFWANNKDSIKSGVVSAGKYSYQGTKFVAKTGYKAGKKQYNTSKNKREGKNGKNSKNGESDEDDVALPTKSITSLNDPASFPPPPLRAGQKQYLSGGQIITGDGSSPPVAPQSTQPPVTLAQAPPSVPSRSVPLQPVTEPMIPDHSAMPIPGQTPIAEQPQLGQPNAPSIGYVRQPMQLPTPPDTMPQPVASVSVNYNDTMPNVITAPVIPARAVTSEPISSSEPESSKEYTPGPHYEVTPFDQTAYDENKEKNKIKIAEIDVEALAPPPKHRDRGINVIPKRKFDTDSSRSTSNLKNSGPSTPTGLPVTNNASTLNTAGMPPKPPSRTSTQESISSGEPSVSKINEPPKAAIVGEYHETATAFAPPPKPHRTINQPKFQKTSSNPSNIGVPASRSPSIPQRDSDGSPNIWSDPFPPHVAKATIGRDSSTPNDEVPNSAVLGAYTEKPVSFAPPPKPFRFVETNNDSRSNSNISSRSSITSNVATHQKVPEPPKRINIQNLNTASAEVQSNSSIGIETPVERSVSSFLPPPKPYRQLENEKSERPSSSNGDNGPFVAKKIAPPIVPKKNTSQIPSSFIKEDKPISSFLPPPIAPSRNYNKSSNTSGRNDEEPVRQSETKGPPPVKPKPRTLYKMSFNSESQAAASEENLTENKSLHVTKKNKPPVVKPKPKNLRRFNTSNINEVTNELNSIHLSSVKKLKDEKFLNSNVSNEHSAIDTTDQDDNYNPFSVYKKDAVPVDEDRLHHRK